MSTTLTTIAQSFLIDEVRSEFPALSVNSLGARPSVYLDSAATAHKPHAVIKRINDFYSFENSNVHRGVHTLSAQATAHFEEARQIVSEFLNAESSNEIVFTKGTTDSINLVARSWGEANLKQGDEVIVSEMEHHANIVPWQMLCEKTGAVLRVLPITDSGELDLGQFAEILTERSKLVAVVHVSNTLGTVNNVDVVCSMAKRVGARTLIDGAQAVMHMDVDVRAIGCDFYAFSAHKLYGPTGVGVLYAKQELLESMQPVTGGGGMIETVTFQKTTYTDAPFKFEAGTPHIAGVLGMSSAITWFKSINAEGRKQHETECTSVLFDAVDSIPATRILGTSSNRVGIVSFVVDGLHAHDLGILLDEQGIAVRSGHHCTMPLLSRLGVKQTVRASLGVYSTEQDIELFRTALEKSIRMLS